MPRPTICDGDACHAVAEPLRVYDYSPTYKRSLCEPCFRRETELARRILAASAIPELWPLREWETAGAYEPASNGETNDESKQACQ